MKKIILLGISSVLIFSGCQSNQVKLSEQDASTAYFSCLNQQYNKAIKSGSSTGEKGIDIAIDSCKDDAMNYAMVFARGYHQRADKHWDHATYTYMPIIEKTSKKELLKFLN